MQNEELVSELQAVYQDLATLAGNLPNRLAVDQTISIRDRVGSIIDSLSIFPTFGLPEIAIAKTNGLVAPPGYTPSPAMKKKTK